MIDVIWWNASRGNWDSGLILETFNKYPELFPQHNAHKNIFPERAIVVVVGRPAIEPLREYLETIKSGIVILTGDEECSFECEKAIPDHLDIWSQCWAPHRKNVKEKILLGCPNRLVDYKINSHLPKKYTWSFIGQVQNPHRDACVEVLKTLPDGFLHIAPMFGGQEGGIEYQEYLDICCQSKYVICPSGSMTADTFRLYEAIECGAIPITDARSPRDAADFNYWDEVYPMSGLMTVSNWDELVKFQAAMDRVTYFHSGWWFDYKKQLEQKLLNISK